ncbi:TPA: hypothetical protein QDB28_005226 [Burkholderia vietnamiensis]|uniref:hypothetical protein n=1 Tax=Burkholderia vietnamiensis TaxID=60552 RepID=UPI00158C968C|nr:hypothetical protein [Burkholderia vietnamiensis]HDR9164791.1 hypothetical protein [Burkholderia vietnamiensis]
MDDFDWTRLYICTRLYTFDGKRHIHPLDPKEVGEIWLYRYCLTAPTSDIPANSFWTEFTTDTPKYASEGTGIFLNECKWRIEWKLPLDKARLLVEQHQKRMSGVGAHYEYTNLFPVSLSDCTIVQMQPNI